jgi:uncharacterized protein YndB with AHSA1/START domain
MTDETHAAKPPIVIERSYEADIEDVWDLWTTKDGFESWWGPDGFRVEVHAIEPRAGGELRYDMIAVGAEQIAFMKQAGMGLSHPTRSTFAEVVPRKRLLIRSVIDFLPGVTPYENDVLVEFAVAGARVTMVIAVHQHHDEHFTKMAAMGWESQLGKLPAALARRREQRAAGAIV